MNILLNKFNKITKILFIFVIVFFSTGLIFAEEKINNFDVNIKINSNSSILISETIKYDFGDIEKRGIYRDIPVKYDGKFGSKIIELKIQSVTRNGLSEEYAVSSILKDKRIKIGNANVFIKGEQAYVITYEAIGAIGYFDNYDELYWNIVGNKWSIPVENITAKIELPENTNVIQSSCYIGVLNSKEECNLNIENNIIYLNSSRSLNPNEDITIAVGFPKEVVIKEDAFSLVEKNNEAGPLGNVGYFLIFSFLIPVIVTFLIMFFIWKKKGRDSRYSSTIIAEYEPPKNMKPTLVGSLIDGRVDFNDITAGLIYLAEQGFVRINKIEKQSFLSMSDHELELLKNDVSGLEIAEKNILNLFFDSSLLVGTKKKLSELRKDVGFPVRNKKVMNEIYQEMADRGFYEKNPIKVKTPYFVFSAVFFFLGISILPFLFLPSIIIFIFSFMMSKKTKLGVETKNHILGFKIFLSVTEKDRIDFHNAPERNPEQFMEFLPYAIALGVEKKWAKQFDGIYIAQPSWYGSNAAGAFIAADFVSSMSGFSNSVNSFSSGGSGSGGRGFSGGGGGGGGGGSW